MLQMRYANSRGHYILEMAARMGSHILHMGAISTYHRFVYGEEISDVSLVSEDIVTRSTDWSVAEVDYVTSDHYALSSGSPLLRGYKCSSPVSFPVIDLQLCAPYIVRETIVSIVLENSLETNTIFKRLV